MIISFSFLLFSLVSCMNVVFQFCDGKIENLQSRVMVQFNYYVFSFFFPV